jgi:hypothetical protein
MSSRLCSCFALSMIARRVPFGSCCRSPRSFDSCWAAEYRSVIRSIQSACLFLRSRLAAKVDPFGRPRGMVFADAVKVVIAEAETEESSFLEVADSELPDAVEVLLDATETEELMLEVVDSELPDASSCVFCFFRLRTNALYMSLVNQGYSTVLSSSIFFKVPRGLPCTRCSMEDKSRCCSTLASPLNFGPRFLFALFMYSLFPDDDVRR